MAKEKGLNRVVVAACSPRTLEPLFRDTLGRRAQSVLLRHGQYSGALFLGPLQGKRAATQKAKDIVRMSVARSPSSGTLAGIRPAGQQSGAGGGRRSAGMTCALSIADQGHAVHLLEKDADLGGAARRIHTTLDGQDVQAYLRDLIHQVYRHPSIHVYTDAVITEATGYVGNFETRVTSERGLSTIEHGVAVIAVGAEEYKPAEYLYGKDDRVMTHLDLGERIAKQRRNGSKRPEHRDDPMRRLPK
jgi:heterodisulfide reductase subunit A